MLCIQQLLNGTLLTISTGRVICNYLLEIPATFNTDAIRNLWPESRNRHYEDMQPQPMPLATTHPKKPCMPNCWLRP